jgi:hypothetical protein
MLNNNSSKAIMFIIYNINIMNEMQLLDSLNAYSTGVESQWYIIEHFSTSE